jgi:hypothetical protein
VFTSDFIRSRDGGGEPSDAPIFIVGMPRSGTTLVEQILASHGQVFAAGELQDMSRLVASIRRADGAHGFPELVPAMAVAPSISVVLLFVVVNGEDPPALGGVQPLVTPPHG